MVLFDGFELLDVCGPLELLGRRPDDFAITIAGPTVGAVASHQGVEVVATVDYAAVSPAQIVMVPGGMGTRALVNDQVFLGWLRAWAGDAEVVSSVCTGSALLAAAGLLDGYRATSNKRAFGWASSHGADVEWVASARWVHDRDRWTSSGVAAGMDMTAALMAHLIGEERAREVADEIELEVRTDPHNDPFAVAPYTR